MDCTWSINFSVNCVNIFEFEFMGALERLQVGIKDVQASHLTAKGKKDC